MSVSRPQIAASAIAPAARVAGAPTIPGRLRSRAFRTAASLLALLLTTPGTARTEPQRIGLTELETQGMPEAEAGMVNDRLRTELLRSGKVRLVERQAVDRVLREQAFQGSGACGEECAASLGKMLAAEAMLVPSARCGRDLCTLGARLVDVATGEVTLSVDQEGPQGNREVLLNTTVPALVERLLNSMAGSPAFLSRGELHVEVDDPEARLRLDGKAIDGQGSFALEGIAAGTHRLEARTAQRRVEKEVRLEPGQVLRVSLELAQATGRVMLLSRPLGAQVFSDRLLIGETPQKSMALPVGSRTLLLRKLGYLDTTLRVAVNMDSVRRIHVQLTPSGTLEIEPPLETTARLWYAGIPLAAEASTRIPLRTGRWHLKLSAPGWVPVDREIEILHGRTTTVSLERTEGLQAP